MADISKCDGDGCPLKDKCYRYLVVADDFYQYYIKGCYNTVYGSCNSFIDVPK